MTTFDARERAYEQRFAHDREILFKAEARRDKVVGLWAADLLGERGEAAETYADHLVSTGIETGAGGVLARLEADFGAAGVPLSDNALSAMMDLELAKALDALRRDR